MMRETGTSRAVRAVGVFVVGLSLLGIAARAEAQWGAGYGFGGWGGATGGYGFGGWGGTGYGYGGWGWGWGGMGMTLDEQQLFKMQAAMNNEARYNLMNAAAAENYSAANLMQQQAANAALEYDRASGQMAADQYNLYTQAKNESMKKARESVPVVPLRALVDEQGRVRWPAVAPAAGAHAERRGEVDAAVTAIVRELAGTGRASLSNVMAAKDVLHAYGEPALALLRSRNDRAGRAEMVTFLNTLEAALTAVGQGPEGDEAGGGNVPPPPRPGGRTI